ncbi:MAG: hypothetical protein HN580_10915, partial [Deltaproteobacteria bacterium]|nr:hypothetical protein [Deltaproteobacteria bacterium]
LSGLTISAREQPDHCEICQGRMLVRRSYTHQGRTLAHGMFDVTETFWVCADGCLHPSGRQVVQRAESVARTLMAGSSIGYDVLVFIGLERYLHQRQREEIQSALLRKYGIRLSTGEISMLARRFAEYLARLHMVKTEQLKATLDQDGGWPLHVDATGESGRGTLLVVMAGWRKWVMGAWKIATEKQELIVPCLQTVVRRFGTPCAVMRDLGRAVTPAVETLVNACGGGIPVLACHQHFLSDIGRDLLGISHNELRNLFRRFKILSQLRGLVRDLGGRIGEGIDEAREVVLRWQKVIETDHKLPQGQNGLAVVRAFTQWVLDYKADATGLDFPYDRPYLDLYGRCLTALRAADAFLHNSSGDNEVLRYARRLHRTLIAVTAEVPFRQVVQRMRRRGSLFDELRNQLRLSSEMPEGESAADLYAMRQQFEEWTEDLKNSRPERGPAEDMRETIDIILKHIKVHGPNLWGHAIALPDGNLKLVARTNALLENFFGEMKHSERRRSGRKNLTQDLEHLPAEATLVYNLNHSDYVSIVCGSLEQLPEAFAQIDAKKRADQNQGVRPETDIDLKRALQLSTASMSTADRRIIRNENMDSRIQMAANSRAPRILY